VNGNTGGSSNTWLSVINHNSVRLQAALVDFGFQPATVPIETLGKPDAVLAVGIEPVRIDLLNRMDGVTFKDARANVVRGRYGNVEVTFIGKEEVELGQSSLTPGFAQPGQDATRLRQVMGGVNWRANRYVRVSFNYVTDWTNKAVEAGEGQVADTYGIWWGRVAAFF